ncbi:pyridoxamine 5'-phosphate oxidase family protein [Actinomadura kijaniata]|uniref:pyridoxamine 5'-phosphate oxidase family protein n=1 Tax=Actinomadura kijaniata TaxID=46161 RepID=UPI003F1A51C3
MEKGPWRRSISRLHGKVPLARAAGCCSNEWTSTAWVARLAWRGPAGYGALVPAGHPAVSQQGLHECRPERDGVLDTAECRALLSSDLVGRIVFTGRALPAVQPVNYALADDHVIIRTTASSRLSTAAHGAVVAFEIDDFDPASRTGWSVVVVGRAERVPPASPNLAQLRGHPLWPWRSATGTLTSTCTARSSLAAAFLPPSRSRADPAHVPSTKPPGGRSPHRRRRGHACRCAQNLFSGDRGAGRTFGAGPRPPRDVGAGIVEASAGLQERSGRGSNGSDVLGPGAAGGDGFAVGEEVRSSSAVGPVGELFGVAGSEGCERQPGGYGFGEDACANRTAMDRPPSGGVLVVMVAW